METEKIHLEDCGGVLLAPSDTCNITLTNGNTSGWVVTAGTFTMDNEFHFLYSGSSHDSYGQMHFALTKAFTKNYAAHGSVIQDASVSITANTYEFDFVEYPGEESPRGEFTGTPTSLIDSSMEMVLS